MTTQPEALALADILGNSVQQVHNDASDELRRLHEANQELLEALSEIVSFWDLVVPNECEMHIKARAAIAKATGETK